MRPVPVRVANEGGHCHWVGEPPDYIIIIISTSFMQRIADCTKLLARHMTCSDDHCELEMLVTVNQY